MVASAAANETEDGAWLWAVLVVVPGGHLPTVDAATTRINRGSAARRSFRSIIALAGKKTKEGRQGGAQELGPIEEVCAQCLCVSNDTGQEAQESAPHDGVRGYLGRRVLLGVR